MVSELRSEWMPIDSVPARPAGENQITVLLWVSNGGDNGKGSVEFGCAYLSRDGSKKARANGYHGDWKITHWMPLPPPPKEAKP